MIDQTDGLFVYSLSKWNDWTAIYSKHNEKWGNQLSDLREESSCLYKLIFDSLNIEHLHGLGLNAVKEHVCGIMLKDERYRLLLDKHNRIFTNSLTEARAELSEAYQSILESVSACGIVPHDNLPIDLIAHSMRTNELQQGKFFHQTMPLDIDYIESIFESMKDANKLVESFENLKGHMITEGRWSIQFDLVRELADDLKSLGHKKPSINEILSGVSVVKDGRCLKDLEGLLEYIQSVPTFEIGRQRLQFGVPEKENSKGHLLYEDLVYYLVEHHASDLSDHELIQLASTSRQLSDMDLASHHDPNLIERIVNIYSDLDADALREDQHSQIINIISVNAVNFDLDERNENKRSLFKMMGAMDSVELLVYRLADYIHPEMEVNGRLSDETLKDLSDFIENHPIDDMDFNAKIIKLINQARITSFEHYATHYNENYTKNYINAICQLYEHSLSNGMLDKENKTFEKFLARWELELVKVMGSLNGSFIDDFPSLQHEVREQLSSNIKAFVVAKKNAEVATDWDNIKAFLLTGRVPDKVFGFYQIKNQFDDEVRQYFKELSAEHSGRLMLRLSYQAYKHDAPKERVDDFKECMTMMLDVSVEAAQTLLESFIVTSIHNKQPAVINKVIKQIGKHGINASSNSLLDPDLRIADLYQMWMDVIPEDKGKQLKALLAREIEDGLNKKTLNLPDDIDVVETL